MDEKPNIPYIGAAKGLFEMLVPGVFLLINLVFFLNYFSNQFSKNSAVFDILKGNTLFGLVVIIVFGYLIGVVLWLIGAENPDNLSTIFRRIASTTFRRIIPTRFRSSKEDPSYYMQAFPYINGLGSIVEKYLPKEAINFYANCWEPRKFEEKNKYFLNYCKTLINAKDPQSAFEISSNEALIRYIAAMFYALLISLILVVVIFIFEYFACTPFIYNAKQALNLTTFACLISPKPTATLIDSVIFIAIYIASICLLLRRLRYMRFKEVQTVFVASLINKDTIGHYLSDNPMCRQAVGQTTADEWNNKGWEIIFLGEYGEAIKAFNKAIEINPHLAGAWYNKGLALKLLDRIPEADEAFAKAKELEFNG
jgi:tetratricopeptide (TPR) repeat protein